MKMKKIMLTVVLLVVGAAGYAQEITGASDNPAMAGNLFKNGDMNNGNVAWQGDRSFVADGDNRALAIKAKKDREQSFFQTVRTDKIKDLVLKFKYKTTDYKGRGLQLRGVRANGGFTYNDLNIKTDGAWHEEEWKFSRVSDSPTINFVFIVKEGAGTVLFDDIIVKEKDAQ